MRQLGKTARTQKQHYTAKEGFEYKIFLLGKLFLC